MNGIIAVTKKKKKKKEKKQKKPKQNKEAKQNKIKQKTEKNKPTRRSTNLWVRFKTGMLDNINNRIFNAFTL